MLVGLMLQQKKLKTSANYSKRSAQLYRTAHFTISTAPTLCKDRLEPRHIDLRPFIWQGENTFVTAVFNQVALRKVHWWLIPHKAWQ